MSMQNGHPSLIKHLAAAEVERLAEKRLLGMGYDVSLLPLLTAGIWLFQKGAILGRARHDRLDILAKLLVGLETLGKLFAELGVTSDLAKSDKWVFWYLDRLSNEAMARRKEPESLLALWLAMLVPPEVEFRENGKGMQPTKKRIPLAKASEWVDRWILTGISFGATFPDLTGRLWKQSYWIYDPDSWAQARQWGMDIPEHFTPLPLEIMEQNVLLEVAGYAEEYFPELVDPLGLRSSRESIASSISG